MILCSYYILCIFRKNKNAPQGGAQDNKSIVHSPFQTGGMKVSPHTLSVAVHWQAIRRSHSETIMIIMCLIQEQGKYNMLQV